MAIDTIIHEGKEYPKFQSEGFASQFSFPFAEKLCKGKGLDIGCNRPEWCFPGAFGIDKAFHGGMYHAMNIPERMELQNYADGEEKWDYLFSSHVLEHLEDWVGVLNYWKTKLKEGGVIFLYLPHYSQTYWRPWSNRKHVNILTPEIMNDYFKGTGWKISFVSGADLNNSFYAVAEK